MTLQQYVGRRIRQAREERGLSQQEVADALGVTRPLVTQVEGGDILITLEHLIKLPRITGRPVTFFLPGEFSISDVNYDPTLAEIVKAWPDLTEEARQALRNLMVTFRGMRQ